MVRDDERFCSGCGSLNALYQNHRLEFENQMRFHSRTRSFGPGTFKRKSRAYKWSAVELRATQMHSADRWERERKPVLSTAVDVAMRELRAGELSCWE